MRRGAFVGCDKKFVGCRRGVFIHSSELLHLLSNTVLLSQALGPFIRLACLAPVRFGWCPKSKAVSTLFYCCSVGVLVPQCLTCACLPPFFFCQFSPFSRDPSVQYLTCVFHHLVVRQFRLFLSEHLLPFRGALLRNPTGPGQALQGRLRLHPSRGALGGHRPGRAALSNRSGLYR